MKEVTFEVLKRSQIVLLRSLPLQLIIIGHKIPERRDKAQPASSGSNGAAAK